jgi:hypothetical protein
MLRFCASWGGGNQLRPRDEFGLTVAPNALPLSGEPPIPTVVADAVEDLARISTAAKRPILLPQNFAALAAQRGVGLRMIADTACGLEPEVGIGELVLWYEDQPGAYEDLVTRAESGELVVPWAIAFPLLGEDFEFGFDLQVFGGVTLEPADPSEGQPTNRKAVRVVPTASTRGRLTWHDLA